MRDFAGRDTYDSCVRAREVFGVERVLLVSQGYHLPRAVAICRAVGLDADGVGDRTGERYRTEWRRGTLREVPASVKAVLDVVSGRDPVLGPAEPGVRDALAAPVTARPGRPCAVPGRGGPAVPRMSRASNPRNARPSVRVGR